MLPENKDWVFWVPHWLQQRCRQVKPAIRLNAVAWWIDQATMFYKTALSEIVATVDNGKLTEILKSAGFPVMSSKL